jgi:hypothetical protein
MTWPGERIDQKDAPIVGHQVISLAMPNAAG